MNPDISVQSNKEVKMTVSSEPEKIKGILHKSLEILQPIEQCALLDYPAHANIGDNLIWLGQVFYLTDVLKTKINYAASYGQFSESEMEKRIKKSPIFLSGGGNLGDLWQGAQRFRERIISKYRDRPIIILPQSIYFAEQANLLEAEKIFNSHPDLTIFVRDNYSHKIAEKHFYKCRVIKSPDMAFQLVNFPGISFKQNQEKPILFHCRKDDELNQTFSAGSVHIPDLVIEDWISYKYISEYYRKFSTEWHLSRILVGLSEGTVIPKEWISRQIWKKFHPYASKFNTIHNPAIHREAFSYMHNGVYQFKQYRLIITNRLHGHILCTLMNIPHVFLPNSYYKNEGFYEAWTSSVPFCRFVKDPVEVPSAVQELLNSFTS